MAFCGGILCGGIRRTGTIMDVTHWQMDCYGWVGVGGCRLRPHRVPTPGRRGWHSVRKYQERIRPDGRKAKAHIWLWHQLPLGELPRGLSGPRVCQH